LLIINKIIIKIVNYVRNKY